jgi:hypothetical protein
MQVWAAGCVLVELLTAMPLFPGRSELDELHLVYARFVLRDFSVA